MLTKTKENSKKNLTKQDILNSVLISTHYTLKVLSGFIISAIVSIFGLFPLVQSFFDSERSLYITIFGFVFLLILIDSIKRGTLTRYYNSKLKNTILGSKVRRGYLNISLIAIAFVVLIDGVGAWLTGVAGQNFYIENKAVQTEEYRNIEVGKENDNIMLNAYQLDLKSYQKRESDYRALCEANLASGKWKDPVTFNMNNWYKKNPRPIAPKVASSTQRNEEFNIIKDGNKSFLDEYLQYIIFIVLVLLTGLLQYLTISEIKEDYEDTEESLTPNRVTNLQTAIATAQDIEEQHEKATFQNKEKLQEKKNEQFREMKILEDKREIVLNAKAVNNGNEGLKRIANNNAYVPSEESKAGFYHNPFGQDENRHDQSRQTEAKSRHDEARQTEQKELVIKSFEKSEISIIRILFKDFKLNRHDQLETRDNVVKELHQNGYGKVSDLNTKMTLLYNKLMEQNIIYKKTAYYSDVDVII